MVAEMSFRKLNAPELVEKVADGTRYDNGKESGSPPKSFYTLFDNGSTAYECHRSAWRHARLIDPFVRITGMNKDFLLFLCLDGQYTMSLGLLC